MLEGFLHGLDVAVQSLLAIATVESSLERLIWVTHCQVEFLAGHRVEHLLVVTGLFTRTDVETLRKLRPICLVQRVDSLPQQLLLVFVDSLRLIRVSVKTISIRSHLTTELVIITLR